MIRVIQCLIFPIAFLFVANTFSATLVTLPDSSGRLLGATDVDVNGTSYDVTFMDGFCSDIFSGCDDASDFAFNSAGDAAAASQALLDQVLIDTDIGFYDSFFNDTVGCQFASPLLGCRLITPYGIGAVVGSPNAFAAVNYSFSHGDDEVLSAVSGFYSSSDTTSLPFTYAVWAVAVPLPGALWLFLPGTLGILFLNQQKRQLALGLKL